METDLLTLECREWRDLVEQNPAEMEVIAEMMIEADEELCFEQAA